MNELPYVLLRLVVGTSLFGHGLVRLPKLSGFSAWMVGSFEKSMLPTALVTPFSYGLPIAEFILGILVLLGLFSQLAFTAGVMLMLMLMFGTCLIENWEALPSQLIHAALLIVLLQCISSNGFSLDKLFFRK